MAGKTLCLLGDFATSPVLSSLKHFRKEYEACLQRAIETPVGAPA
jgi:NADH:ubiquinone oxidoreductase subunit F (NADH-binding)